MPMKIVRTHQSLIAWMLYGFILFSGLVCSLSHGQMLRAFNHVSDPAVCGEHPAMSAALDMAQMSKHAQLMKWSMNDCAFAGALTLSLVFFIGLRWLARSVRKVLPRSDYLLRRPPRQLFRQLLPQAP